MATTRNNYYDYYYGTKTLRIYIGFYIDYTNNLRIHVVFSIDCTENLRLMGFLYRSPDQEAGRADS